MRPSVLVVYCAVTVAYVMHMYCVYWHSPLRLYRETDAVAKQLMSLEREVCRYKRTNVVKITDLICGPITLYKRTFSCIIITQQLSVASEFFKLLSPSIFNVSVKPYYRNKLCQNSETVERNVLIIRHWRCMSMTSFATPSLNTAVTSLRLYSVAVLLTRAFAELKNTAEHCLDCRERQRGKSNCC